MAYTSPYDPKSTEARSSWLAGLTEAMSIVTRQLNLKSEKATVNLTELFIEEDDRRRIYQADTWNKLWLTDPPPVIKMDDVVITPENDGFTIDHLGGSIVFEDSRRPQEDVTITAEVTHLIGREGTDRSEVLENIKTELARLEKDKQNNLTFDDKPTEESENPVKSQGIKNYVDETVNTAVGEFTEIDDGTIDTLWNTP